MPGHFVTYETIQTRIAEYQRIVRQKNAEAAKWADFLENYRREEAVLIQSLKVKHCYQEKVAAMESAKFAAQKAEQDILTAKTQMVVTSLFKLIKANPAYTSLILYSWLSPKWDITIGLAATHSYCEHGLLTELVKFLAGYNESAIAVIPLGEESYRLRDSRTDGSGIEIDVPRKVLENLDAFIAAAEAQVVELARSREEEQGETAIDAREERRFLYEELKKEFG